MFWEEKIECMSRDEIVRLKEKRLKGTVRYAYEHGAFYTNQFDAHGIHPEGIWSLDDISSLPFTTKLDLRDHYPHGFCAVPLSLIVRVHASSGTTGKPTPAFFTKRDLENWTTSMARNFCPSCH